MVKESERETKREKERERREIPKIVEDNESRRERKRNKRKSHLSEWEITQVAQIYLATVMKYLAAEVLEMAGNAVRDKKKTLIIHIHFATCLAVRIDEESKELLAGLTIAQGHNFLS